MTRTVSYRRCNRLVVLTGLSLLCGCCSFENKWKAAAAQESTATTTTTTSASAGIEGRWEGTWQSDGNKHSGGLRCIVTKTGDDAYAAEYKATYWGIFRFGYAMPLTIKQRDDSSAGKTAFAGEADLGWLAGGVYRYDGTADGTDFLCKYDSKYDVGTFTMKRPKAGE